METKLVLVRHGETEWSRTRRHTGHSDIPLTDVGENAAAKLSERLSQWRFELVMSSSRKRALDTARLALPGVEIEIDDNLIEWDYGEYEGITTKEIHLRDPDWNLWVDGAPHGESPSEVGARADAVLARIEAVDGTVALFAHGHVLRVLAARWLGLTAEAGSYFALDTATISTLGFEHARPVMTSWNTATDQ